MTVQTFYRFAVWLPLILPGLIGIGVFLVGMPADDGLMFKPLQILVISGIYGGLPYAILAAWGTWWIDSRPEPEIRHRAILAPLIMLAGWLALAATLGTIFSRAEIFTGLIRLGAPLIIGLGYGYVGLVLLIRRFLDLTDDSRPSPPALPRVV